MPYKCHTSSTPKPHHSTKNGQKTTFINGNQPISTPPSQKTSHQIKSISNWSFDSGWYPLDLGLTCSARKEFLYGAHGPMKIIEKRFISTSSNRPLLTHKPRQSPNQTHTLHGQIQLQRAVRQLVQVQAPEVQLCPRAGYQVQVGLVALCDQDIQ